LGRNYKRAEFGREIAIMPESSKLSPILQYQLY
jgi:hypothetical protein